MWSIVHLERPYHHQRKETDFFLKQQAYDVDDCDLVSALVQTLVHITVLKLQLAYSICTILTFLLARAMTVAWSRSFRNEDSMAKNCSKNFNRLLFLHIAWHVTLYTVRCRCMHIAHNAGQFYVHDILYYPLTPGSPYTCIVNGEMYVWGLICVTFEHMDFAQYNA